MLVHAAGQAFRSDSDPLDVMNRITAAWPSYLEQTFARLGVTQSEGARAVGLARQTFAKLFDVDEPKPFRIGMLYLLPLPVKLAIVADILGATHAVVTLPGKDAAEHSIPWFAQAVREVSEAVVAAITAASDGRFDRIEGAEVERLCDRAIGLLLSIRELARAAQREGVIGLSQMRVA